MTTEQKMARRKVGVLDLASDVGNVSKACKVVGYRLCMASLSVTQQILYI